MNDMMMQTVLWLSAGGLLVMLMMRRSESPEACRADIDDALLGLIP